MEFAFTEEQELIGDTAKGFFLSNATSVRTRTAMEKDGLDRDLWASFCGELGLAGIALAEENGGAGLGLVEFAIVAEAAGTHVATAPLLSLAMAARAIEFGGNDAQKKKWLPALISGEIIAAPAFEASVSPQNNKLTGNLNFVSHGGIADIFVVSSSDGAWIIESSAQGVEVMPLGSLDQTRPFATVVLNDAIGNPLENAQSATAAALQAGWICLAAESLGGAQACLDRTCDYAKDRVQFGRSIGSFQAYKHRLADMMIEIEQARSAVYWAACAVDEKSEEAPLAVHAAKSFCADTFFKCAGDMIQLHGGIGFTWEHDAHLYFKRAKVNQEMLMNGQWHREQIAKMIMGTAA